MYLTNLATIARRAGLTVVEQPGWQTRGHGGMIDVRTIVCHHTAGPASGNAPSLGVVQNGRPDLPGPLAHFLLARDGTVYVVAAGLCYHAGAVLRSDWGNAYAIGIEAEGTGTASWPETQVRAFAALCRALQDTFGASVLGHKEICSPAGRKIDPNFDMAAFRGRVATSTTSGGGGNSPAADQGEDLTMNRVDCKAIPDGGFAEIDLPGTERSAITIYPGHDPVWVGNIYFWGEGHVPGNNQTGGLGGNPSPGPDALRVSGITTFTVPGALLAQVEFSSNTDFHIVAKG